MNKHNNKTTIFFDLFGVLLGTDQSVVVHYISKQIGLPYSKTHEIVLGEMFMRLVRREINFNTYYQFLRIGYFCIDKTSKKNKLIFNRTSTLRDSWKKT